MNRLRLASVAELPERGTVKFEFDREGIRFNGFIARFRGTLVAYENLCRHLPLTLDYDDNRFFSPDEMFFVCRNHGAVFEPLTGLCVRGPCQGASLKPLTIEIENGVVWLVDEGADG